jgi:hypothetical protein
MKTLASAFAVSARLGGETVAVMRLSSHTFAGRGLRAER